MANYILRKTHLILHKKVLAKFASIDSKIYMLDIVINPILDQGKENETKAETQALDRLLNKRHKLFNKQKELIKCLK